MALSTAAAGIILQYTGPVFCALFAWIFQRRAIGGRTMIALLIAMLGITIMLIGGMHEGASLAGLINGAISGVAFGGLILTLEVVNRRGHNVQPINPFLIVMFNNLGTALVVFPIALHYGHVKAEPWQLGTMAATGVVQLAIPYVLFVLALRRVEPVDASLLILLEPVLNPIWVWFAVGERPDVATFIGGAAILVAMLIEATKEKASGFTKLAVATDTVT
jgi:drug/metabolite transporter (DMT)-like permease